MNLKFCADGDCPLWVLAALHALGSLPTPLFKCLLQHVLEENPDDGIMDILKDTSLCTRDECARAAAALRWVVQQCWRNACTSAQFTRDLLKLGVPRAHATLLADAAHSHRDAWLAHVHNNHFTVNRLTNASVSPGPEGTVDTITLQLFSDDHTTGGEKRKHDLLLDQSLARLLLDELKQVLQKMDIERN